MSGTVGLVGVRDAADLRRQLHNAITDVRWVVDGLSDQEFFWEPVTPCWSIRRREDAVPGWGTGAWVCEDGWPPPDPVPVTTIGWRIVHLSAWTDVYRDWTFGRARLSLADLHVPGSATEAIRWLHQTQDDFAAQVAGLADTDLRQLRPTHYGTELSVHDLVLAIATEHIHHGAEVGVLRDLRRGHARIQPPSVRGEV